MALNPCHGRKRRGPSTIPGQHRPLRAEQKKPREVGRATIFAGEDFDHLSRCPGTCFFRTLRRPSSDTLPRMTSNGGEIGYPRSCRRGGWNFSINLKKKGKKGSTEKPQKHPLTVEKGGGWVCNKRKGARLPIKPETGNPSGGTKREGRL